MAGTCGECDKKKGTETLYRVRNGRKSKKCSKRVCKACAERMVATGNWSY